MDYSAFMVPVVTLLTAQATVLDLGRFRFPLKKMLLILSIQLLVQAICCGSVLFFLGLDAYTHWFFLIVDLPAFLVFAYTTKRRDLRDVFTVLLTIFINMSISIPAIWVSQQIHGGYHSYSLVRIVLFVFVFLLLHYFMRERYIQLQDAVEKGWGIFSIQPAIGLAFIYSQYLHYGINEDNTLMLLNCVIICLLILVNLLVHHYVFNQLREKYLLQEQQRILTLQNKAQLDQFAQQKETAELTNHRWHDLRHSTQELIELLEAGEAEAALAYLKAQSGVLHVPKETFCLHPAVNSILCLWAERSRRAGIALALNTDIPANLNIDPMELSALVANAFENAFDGCLRLPEGAERFIKAEARYNGKQLAVGFTNSCVSDIPFENGLPVSEKSGGGIGTKSMVYTIRRYHGTVFFEAKDQVFTVRFILKV